MYPLCATVLSCVLLFGSLSGLAQSLLEHSASAFEESRILNSAEVLYLPSQTQKWEAVEGPILWNQERYQIHTSAKIRYALPGRVQLVDDPAIYLWRYSMNARVFLNQVLLSEVGSMAPPSRNLHLPQLVRLPASLLNEAQNTVVIELSVIPGYGYLLPPVLGSYAELKPQYDQRYFNQITLQQIIFGLTVFLMLLGLVLWLFDTSSQSYLYFSLAAFSWSIYSVNPFIQDLPFSQSVWLWILHIGIDLFCVALVMFTHRHFRLVRPRTERLVWMYLAMSALAYVSLGENNFSTYSTWVHFGSFGLIFYAIATTLWLGIKSDRRDAFALLFCFVVFIGLGIHDALLTAAAIEVLWLNSFFMLSLGAPLFLLCAGAQLMWQLRRANLHMERSLADAKIRLEDSYRARANLEQDKAMSQERARIYRDLHDDLGAKLLDLVYLADNDKQAAIARDALHEIRSIVSMPQREGLSLSDWSTQMLLELTERLEAVGVALHWQVAESKNHQVMLTGIQQYHMTRIVRELVSNVIKHAGATSVKFDLKVGSDLYLQCSDDGAGVVRHLPDSTGLSGIARRIRELGGAGGNQVPSDIGEPVMKGFTYWFKIPIVA